MRLMSSRPYIFHTSYANLSHCASFSLQPARVIAEIEETLKLQLIISTLIMTPVAYYIATAALPEEFTLMVPGAEPGKPFDTK